MDISKRRKSDDFVFNRTHCVNFTFDSHGSKKLTKNLGGFKWHTHVQ